MDISFNNSSSRDNTFDCSTATPGQIHSIQAIQDKIERARKRIQEEQRRRDENVEEYLKMAAVTQRNQLPQVKAVFEKRNTKAATRIAVLQGKLGRYQKEMQELEAGAKLAAEMSPSKLGKGGTPVVPGDGIHQHGSDNASGSSNTSRTSKGRLLHVGQGIKSVSGNLKDGISGISGFFGSLPSFLKFPQASFPLPQKSNNTFFKSSKPLIPGQKTVINKPREIASNLFKQKFGSADNIPHQLRESDGTHAGHYHHGSAQIPSETRNLNNSGIVNPNTSAGVGSKENVGGSEASVSQQSSSLGHDLKHNSINTVIQADFAAVLQQLNDLREELSNLREEYDTFKNQAAGDSSFLCQGLQEERFRAERLEEQINDLTELHQAETGNLKQALADAEEKLSYQSEERLRDLAEMLDACLTKISRLEQQQQQLVTIEGIENSAARALVVKLVNIGLTLLQLVLLIVATSASTLAPFMGSRIRLFASLLIGLGAFLAHRKWPQVMGAVVEFWTDFLNRL